MKNLSFACLLTIIFSLLFSSCAIPPPRVTPYQYLPYLQKATKGKMTKNVVIYNSTRGGAKFKECIIAPLTMSGNEVSQELELPMEDIELCWTKAAHDGYPESQCYPIFIDRNSKAIEIIPPYQDDKFGTRGKGSLRVNTWLP